jgi:hypothetical protein
MTVNKFENVMVQSKSKSKENRFKNKNETNSNLQPNSTKLTNKIFVPYPKNQQSTINNQIEIKSRSHGKRRETETKSQ